MIRSTQAVNASEKYSRSLPDSLSVPAKTKHRTTTLSCENVRQLSYQLQWLPFRVPIPIGKSERLKQCDNRLRSSLLLPCFYYSFENYSQKVLAFIFNICTGCVSIIHIFSSFQVTCGIYFLGRIKTIRRVFNVQY